MSKESIAIIGMGCRFPQSRNLYEFWNKLCGGVDAITEVCKNRHDRLGLTGLGGFLGELDQFDAEFFRVLPEELVAIDPQQRLLLEVAWEALEDAGQIPEKLVGSNTDVFVGISSSDYHHLLLQNIPKPNLHVTTGNDHAMSANRISYYFDLCGYSLAINTTCSSSLVAIDYACQNLWSSQNSLALVGGSSLILSPELTTRFANAGMLSPEGRCKSFDAKANGYVRGEGVGVVVLKLLSQAEADGDRIYAVIRGSGINHNGRGNGLTAPNMQAQIDLLKKVYQQANINPNSINYIEAHGTATLIGDALEMKALGTVVGKDRTTDNPCRVGCVKTNIGHTEAASGIAGLIKTALSLYHRQIPPNLHFQEPNPSIPFKKLGLKVQERLENLPDDMYPLRAGVSAFGFGGTNAHVVLEEYPSQTKSKSRSKSSLPLKVLTLTAKTATALQELAIRYQDFLQEQSTASLDEICFTANTRRSHFKHRLAIITQSKEQLSEQLNAFINKESLVNVLNSQLNRRKPAPICFICTGKTDHIKSLIKSFYHNQAHIYPPLHECELILASYFKKSFLELIEQDNFEEISHYELINFVCEYAIAQLWRYFAIEPVITTGKGTGRYVSATISGILSIEEAVSLILKKTTLEELDLDIRPAKISMISPITGHVIKVNQVISREQWQQEFNVDANNFGELYNQLIDTNYIQLDINANQIRCYEKNKLDVSLDLNNVDNITHDLNEDNLQSLLSNIIKFWLMGNKVNWAKVGNYKNCYPISLPTYPFERQSYWIGSVSEKSEKDGDHSVNQQELQAGEIQATTNTDRYITEDVSGEFVAPRDRIEKKLAQIWKKTLKCKSIGIHDNFFELGGSSLLAGRILSEIAVDFYTNMPVSAIFQAPTIEKLANILKSEANILPWYSLVPIQSRGSRPILFGIHWLKYKDLSHYLGIDQPVYGLHYGMGDTVNPISLPKIQDLASHYIQEIRSLQPEGPYFLMGLSRGGTIAYEMAQQLTDQNQRVELLVMFDTDLITSDISYYPFLQRIMNRLRMLIDYIWRLGLVEVINRINIRIKVKFRPIISRWFPKINIPKPLLVIEDVYIPKPYLGRVIFFRAEHSYPDFKIDFPEAKWRKLVKGVLDIYTISGSHNSILEKPQVKIIAEKITQAIEQFLAH
jgi:acyl transferase domain-containing protein/pimeloyl-ACP methyl ester carboxylesterase